VKNIRLLADVHISPKTVADLQKQGYEIMRSSEVLPANAPDINILEFARTENWVVLTQDLDFSMLVALSRYSSFLINENILAECFRTSSSFVNPRISPLTTKYERPQLSLLIITPVP